ncbi:MAG: PQQ-binding-like beta-propeller repeat protein [Verrucomicrobiota bacterium]
MRSSLALLFASSLSLCAAEWPGWRGPDQDGSVGGKEPPAQFGPDENLKWKVELPGRGCSTPIVVDGKIILTASIDGKDAVIAYDMGGKELWRESFGKLRPGRGKTGSSANSSAVTDGKGVFVFFKSGQVAGLDLDGKLRWKFNLFEKFGEDKLWWDVGTSPVIAGGNVVIAQMQTDAPEYVVALDPKTGDTVWNIKRPFETGVESADAYTTPLVLEIDGKETIVLWGADHVTGHDPKDGSTRWTIGGINPEKIKAWRTIASSVATGEIALIPAGRGSISFGVKMGGKGDVTGTAHLWKQKIGADASTPIARDGKFYILTDRGPKRGMVYCLDAKTGEIEWEDRLPRGAQTYYSSPLLAGNLLIAARESGAVFTAKVTNDGLEDIVSNELGEGFFASPVVVDGMLLLRGDKTLFCFEK